MNILRLLRNKIILVLIVSLFFSFKSFCQSPPSTWDTLPWKNFADFKLQQLNKSYVSSGILYDRVMPIAQMDEHTGLPSTNSDTTHPDHFLQAYYEMYNSSYNTTGWINPDTLDKMIINGGTKYQHPIGVFCYNYNVLDSNAIQDHLIDTLSNGQFIDVANRPRSPYFNYTAFLATPLLAEDQMMEVGTHEFYIDPNFFLHNKSMTITQIRIDFGDGQGEWVVNSPYQSGGNLRINSSFASSIIKNITNTIIGRIVVVSVDLLGNTIQYGNPFKIFVKKTKQYQPLTDCKGGGQKWVIDSDPNALNQINNQYNNPQLEYKNSDGNPVKDTAYFYFAGDGTTCNTNTVRRPIIFIDGFDPTNTRGVQQIYEDYINVLVNRNSARVRFGDYMLAQGYDFIILDFKHGNDLLERNALTLVALIQRLNQTYGSAYLQDITLIGPSMGSLIAQYALAYMEHNNIQTRVKTYISFDGCHQGANVPIGLQSYVEYLTKRGVLKKIKSIRQGLYNGLAARQMLAHHVSANSQFPAPDALRTTFLQNLSGLGEYPALSRKVALINGANNGTLNPDQGANTDLLRIYIKRKGWKSIWGLCGDNICKMFDWTARTTPNSGTAKVAEMWTLSPLFNLLFWVPPGKTNYYATAAWGNSAQDNAPGGRFGTLFGTEPGNIDESKLVFLMKESLYLITGSKRSSFSQNLNNFTMMPSYSSADLRYQSKNLYLNWSNDYLCGKTPFDYVYAPPINEQHVFVSENGSQWFENEIRCNRTDLPIFFDKSITGNDILCSSGTYSMNSCSSSNATVQWTASPSGIVSITPNAGTYSASVSKLQNGSVTLTATITYPCGGTSFTINKNIIVGTIKPSYINTVPDVCPQYGVNTNLIPNCTYTWSFYKTPYSNNLQSFPNSSNYKKLNINQGSGTYRIGVTADNICGSSAITFIDVPISCGGGGGHLAMTPNPASNVVSVSYKPETAAARSNISANENSSQAQQSIYEVDILDKVGNIKKVFKYSKGAKSVQINVAGLSADIYVINVFDGNNWTSDQLVVK